MVPGAGPRTCSFPGGSSLALGHQPCASPGRGTLRCSPCSCPARWPLLFPLLRPRSHRGPRHMEHRGPGGTDTAQALAEGEGCGRCALSALASASTRPSSPLWGLPVLSLTSATFPGYLWPTPSFAGSGRVREGGEVSPGAWLRSSILLGLLPPFSTHPVLLAPDLVFSTPHPSPPTWTILPVEPLPQAPGVPGDRTLCSR